MTLQKCLLGFQLQREKSSQEVSTETARLNALLGVKDAQIVRSLRWTSKFHANKLTLGIKICIIVAMK